MSVVDAVGLMVVIALAGYLVYALLCPERFQ